MRKLLDARLCECGLELHPNKTRVVYCKDSRRTRTSEHVQFDFLGYTFRPREVFGPNGELRMGFTPAVSRESMKAMRQTLRRWRLHLRSELSLEDLATLIAPRIRGWMGYYCRFRGSEFKGVTRHVDQLIVRWAMRKFKRLRGRKRRAFSWLAGLRRNHPALFHHWCGVGEFRVGTMGAQ